MKWEYEYEDINYKNTFHVSMMSPKPQPDFNIDVLNDDPRGDYYKHQLYYSMRGYFVDLENKTSPKITKPNAVWMTYLPYVSNCDGMGAHIDLHTLMSLDNPKLTDKKCDIVPIGQKNPIDFWLPFVAPQGNECDYELTCYYDERFIGNVTAFKMWYRSMAEQKTYLFRVLKSMVTA